MDDSATVIGGGPAGSASALLLARAGWRVNLVEQHRFPREKVCGECISALGMQVLERLGVASRIRAAGAVCLTHCLLHSPAGASVRLDLPKPMWGLSRGTLDQLLLRAAREQGVNVLQPCRCEALRPADQRGISVQVRDLTDNSTRVVRSDWAIAADGKSRFSSGRPDRDRDSPNTFGGRVCATWIALTSRRTAGQRRTSSPAKRSVFCIAAPAATSDFGIKAHFSGVDGPRHAIELFSTCGTYGGLGAIEGGRWNAAFSVTGGVLRESGGDLQAVFDRLVRGNTVLARRLAGAQRVGSWLASPLPRFALRRHWPERVVPVGGAAAALEPIGGEGMGLALRSAELAADALIAKRSAASLVRAYDALWRIRRVACRGAAKLASSGRMAEIAAEILQHDRRLGMLALALIGK